MKSIAIAIDGPAAAGKSTVAKKVAERLGYTYIDTGAMYRSITYAALEANVDLNKEDEVYNVLEQMELDMNEKLQVFIDGKEVTDQIRSEEVSRNVSKVASYAGVREELVKRQKQMAAKRGVVMDGRDIGTHVIPDAEVKIFMIASAEERAKRRHKENLNKGFTSDYEQLKKEIEERDRIDMEREVSPLKKAEDAIELDTTSLSIEEVVNEIMRIIEEYKG